MEEMTFVAGKKSDIRRIKSLLKSVSLPYEDIDLSKQDFIVSVHSKRIIGVVGLEPYGECGLLRSLAVEEACRGRGLGQALVMEVAVRGKEKGIRHLYLLTLTADRFFEKEGFERISRESMPEAIQNTTEFMSICPVSSACMKKVL